MIETTSGMFHIYTDNTSYIFSVEDTGYPEHIYYGRRLRDPEAALNAIKEKHLKAPTTSTIVDRSYGEFTLDDTLLEFSTEGKGDYKVPSIALSMGEKRERTLDLKYTGCKIYEGIRRYKGVKMPQAVGSDTDCTTLEITYLDKLRHIRYVSYYTAFHHADVITRRNVLYNDSLHPLAIRGISSLQLDLRTSGMSVTTFSGPWARERQENTTVLHTGSIINESRTLASGEADPAVILEKGPDSYMVNLVYSGAHRTSVSVSGHGITHIVTGINPDTMLWTLDKDEYFETPEAVLIYSSEGREKLSALSRSFIEKHIRRGLWKNRLKPIMLNTWDTLHFDAEEADVYKMAKEAKNLGMEGIVVDDGWFGARSDEYSSLGDWYPDTRSFPSGMKELANEVHYLGLSFGLWFELEGISEKSILYRHHPDWILGRKAETNAEGRGQLLLDLSREDVQEWIISTLSRIIDYCSLDYIRWSLSRFDSDMWSNGSDSDSDTLFHRYVLGLYKILDAITKSYPNLYIETTARGGLRLDLGMLSYASSIRMTECTDPLMRLSITQGATQIYPLSVLSTIVASSPDNYTGRSISIESSFNTAVFGALQYSVNTTTLSRQQKFAIAQQVEFYKAYRILLQTGSLRTREEGDRIIWTLSNGDRSAIIALYYMVRAGINASPERLRIQEAREDFDYSFIARDHYQTEIERIMTPQEIECYTIPGDALKWAGIAMADNASGNGSEEGMRFLTDNASRLYIIRKVDRK